VLVNRLRGDISEFGDLTIRGDIPQFGDIVIHGDIPQFGDIYDQLGQEYTLALFNEINHI